MKSDFPTRMGSGGDKCDRVKMTALMLYTVRMP